MKPVQPQTSKAVFLALFCLLSIIAAGCGTKYELTGSADNVPSNVYSNSAADRPSAADLSLSDTSASGAYSSGALHGDPATSASLKAPLAEEPSTAAEETPDTVTSADDNVPLITPTTQELTSQASPHAQPLNEKQSSVSERAMPHNTAVTPAIEPSTAPRPKAAGAANDTTKPAVLHGTGRYVGKADSHSIEIEMKTGPVIFQYDEKAAKLLAKISERDEGTPVDFTYTEKEVTVEGEKYMERWLVSIQER